MKKRQNEKARSVKADNDGSAGELAATFLQALEGAPYTAGAVALTTVLGVWIGRQGDRPQLDARVYGDLLETLVGAVSNNVAAPGEARDVAA